MRRWRSLAAAWLVCSLPALAQEGYSKWSVEEKTALIREKTADGLGLKEHPLAAALLDVLTRQYPPALGLNLAEVKLAGENLSNANLGRADLAGADLSNANLSRANLRGANLAGAQLRGAIMIDAILMGANLTGANLTGANLRYADTLSQEQLDAACGKPAVLPPGLKPPSGTC